MVVKDLSLKSQSLLSVWLKFLDLEAEDNAIIKYLNFVPTKHFQISKNQLIIDENVFSDIKKTHSESFAHDSESGKNTSSLYLSFPTIYRKSINNKNENNYYPCLFLKMDEIMFGEWSESGWDLSELESFISSSNLSTFFAIDDLDQMVSDNIIATFKEIGKLYEYEIHTFEDILSFFKNSFPLGQNRFVKIDEPYLFYFNPSNFTAQLKNDLEELKKSVHEFPPLFLTYLYGHPKPIEDIKNNFLFGRLGNAPTRSQMDILFHYFDSPLSVVQGPPGSGKTTLIVNTIAIEFVRNFIKRDFLFTLVASNNNSAVDGVSNKLSSYGLDDFFLVLGNKVNIAKSEEKIGKRIEWLEQCSFDDCNEKQKRIEHKIETIMFELDEQTAQCRKTLDELFERRTALMNEYNTLFERGNRYKKQLQVWGNIDYETFCYMYLHLEKMYRSVESRKFKFFRKKLSTGQTLEIQRLFVSGSFHFPVPENEVELKNMIDKIRDMIELIQKYNKLNERILSLQDTIGKIDEERTITNHEFAELCQNQNGHDSLKKHEELVTMVMAWRVVFAVSHKNDVIRSLKKYVRFIKNDHGVINLAPSDYQNIALLFPIITSTLTSVRNSFPLHKDIIGNLIVDEAGMIHAFQLIPSVYRSKKMLMVGDIKQLPPIVSLSKEKKEKYFQLFLESELTDDDFLYYSPTSDVATAYHVASGENRLSGSPHYALPIREHFRCVRDIANTFQEISDYDFTVMKDDVHTIFGVNLLGYHVDGYVERLVNAKEVNALCDVYAHLLKNGYQVNDIGIITLFNRQKEQIKKIMGDRFNKTLHQHIGTVHAFQGKEYKVILFSSVLSHGMTYHRMYNTPNLLNVAISRAKELFVLVGNIDIIKQSKNRYLSILLEHIERDGLISPLPDDEKVLQVTGEQDITTEIIINEKHFDVFKKMVKDACEEIIISTPWVYGDMAKWFCEEMEKKEGVQLFLYYGYKKSDQADEDCIQRLLSVIKKNGGELVNLAQYNHPTHEKVLIQDKKKIVIGSWNWLSNPFFKQCQDDSYFKQLEKNKILIRRETSVSTNDPSIVNEQILRLKNWNK